MGRVPSSRGDRRCRRHPYDPASAVGRGTRRRVGSSARATAGDADRRGHHLGRLPARGKSAAPARCRRDHGTVRCVAVRRCPRLARGRRVTARCRQRWEGLRVVRIPARPGWMGGDGHRPSSAGASVPSAPFLIATSRPPNKHRKELQAGVGHEFRRLLPDSSPTPAACAVAKVICYNVLLIVRRNSHSRSSSVTASHE